MYIGKNILLYESVKKGKLCNFIVFYIIKEIYLLQIGPIITNVIHAITPPILINNPK